MLGKNSKPIVVQDNTVKKECFKVTAVGPERVKLEEQ